MAILISDFYENTKNSDGLDKTQAEVLIYTNTENKLKEIFSDYVKLKAEVESHKQGKDKNQIRDTLNKKLNETIYDEVYLSSKVDKLSKKFKNKYGDIETDKVYSNSIFSNFYCNQLS